MGMDYMYSGSRSYPGFDEEVTEIVKLLGGETTEVYNQMKKGTETSMAKYFFGILPKKTEEPKFAFKENIPEIVQKWFNNIYDDYNPLETKEIWEGIKKHPEIEEISWQIWNELETRVNNNEGWSIH